MAQWKFQLAPNEKDSLALGYRMDSVGEAFEDEVNAALRYPFEFHRVNKLVIRLGPPPEAARDYVEQLGVAIKQYPAFSYATYNTSTAEERRMLLVDATKDVFRWLASNFDDADFVKTASRNLGWTL